MQAQGKVQSEAQRIKLQGTRQTMKKRERLLPKKKHASLLLAFDNLAIKNTYHKNTSRDGAVRCVRQLDDPEVGIRLKTSDNNK